MSKDLTIPNFDTAIIQESIIGDDIQIRDYFKAVTKSRIPDLEEILKDKENHKDIIDEKGEINARYLKAVIYVLGGKTGDNYIKLGEHMYYFEKKNKFRELGHSSRHDFFVNTPNLPFSEAYCSKAVQIYELVLHGRLKREDVILLGNKVNLLSDYIIDELTANQLMKLIKKIMNMNGREASQFLKHDYRYFLTGEALPSEQKTIPMSGKGKVKEYVQINFNMPKFETKRDKLELRFDTDWEEQVYALALRNCQPLIQREIVTIINTPEYEKYRKLALKKYKKD